MNAGSGHDRDEWLMIQVAQGHTELLEPLVRRYGMLLLSFIRSLVGDRQQSEDLFQDVFLAVWRKRHLYQFPRPFKPWLYGIAINRVRQVSRRRGDRRQRSFEADAASSELPAFDLSPSDSAIATETSVLVQQAVAMLPQKQRLVVTMRIWNGMSYAEIAQAMNAREGTVRSNMHDALIRIRRFLEPRM
jgi:RNA polymerase sigma-70 factor (ECF subfamily)